MTEEQLFQIIDKGIYDFKKKEGFQKGIKLVCNPSVSWLVFNLRRLSWQENIINYIIEVYPNFDEKENISSWTMYAAAGYDLKKKDSI